MAWCARLASYIEAIYAVVTDFEVTGVTDENFEEVKPPFQREYTNAIGIPKEKLVLKLVIDSRHALSEAIVRVEQKWTLKNRLRR